MIKRMRIIVGQGSVPTYEYWALQILNTQRNCIHCARVYKNTNETGTIDKPISVALHYEWAINGMCLGVCSVCVCGYRVVYVI